MKITNAKIKDNITIVDRISAIESIASAYFTNGKYTPYYADMAKVVAIANNFLDGVTFDDDDYIYDLVHSDEKLSSLVDKFLVPSVSKTNKVYVDMMEDIMNQVEEIVKFEKEKIIHNTDSFSIIGEMCRIITDSLSNLANMSSLSPSDMNTALDFMKQLNDTDITEETLANAARKAADQFKLPESDIIEGQRKRIAEQQKQLTEKETEITELRKWKSEQEARNVKRK